MAIPEEEQMSTVTETTGLSQALAVGQGFDIFDKVDVAALIRPLFDFTAAPTNTFTLRGRDYLIPRSLLAMEDADSYVQSASCSTREEFQNSIAGHLNVEASYGAFSGEMKATFASEFMRNANYSFAYRRYYTRIATVSLVDYGSSLVEEFRVAIAELPAEARSDNQQAFNDFFNRWGVYFVKEITLGGRLDLSVAVSNESKLTREHIGVLAGAQCDALLGSGSVDASIMKSAEWRSYLESAQSSLRSVGGDDSVLAGINALQPSKDTAAAYKAFIESIPVSPAVIDFNLAGIWELCGTAREAVMTAWEKYGNLMHPRLSVQTWSTNLPLKPEPGAHAPVVTLEKNLQPPQEPASPSGVQAIIIDGTDISPSGVRFDQYFSIPYGSSWSVSAPAMWDAVTKALTESPANETGNLLIIATFGLDNTHMSPSSSFYAFLQQAGAGQALTDWMNSTWDTDDEGNWVTWPAAYILVGFLGAGPGTGIEVYGCDLRWRPVAISVNVHFYRQSFGGRYTLGPAAQ